MRRRLPTPRRTLRSQHRRPTGSPLCARTPLRALASAPVPQGLSTWIAAIRARRKGHCMMAWPARLALVLFCCAALPTFAQVPGVGQAPEAAQPAPAPTRPLLKPQELEQLVAPIALYPDMLLAQLLTASTALGRGDRAHARNGGGRQAADRGRGASR